MYRKIDVRITCDLNSNEVREEEEEETQIKKAFWLPLNGHCILKNRHMSVGSIAIGFFFTFPQFVHTLF